MLDLKKSFGLLAGASLIAASQATAVGAAPMVHVEINHQAVQLNPPPLTRNGRVFVPLRGIFERLGANVAYSGGVINATGNNRTISMKIGSTSADVSGTVQQLDVAPFIIGASTYVPLRFVAQALGAGVAYDGNTGLVAVTNGGAPVAAASLAPALKLTRRQPEAGAAVEARQPTVSSDFSIKADPNTLKVMLDGLDVTNQATRSETGIVYAPPSPLQASEHTVLVSGKDTSGHAFSHSWKFTSGTSTTKAQLSITSPAENDIVSSDFTVQGKAEPGSTIHIVAGAAIPVHGSFAVGTGSYTADLNADASGNFSQMVTVNAISGGVVTVTVTSTDQQTKGTAEKKLKLKIR